MSDTDTYIDLLLKPASDGMRDAVRAAFNLGFEAGRRQAAADMKAKLAAVLESDPVVDKEPAAVPSSVEPSSDLAAKEREDGSTPASKRARRGSVRPAVLNHLKSGLRATQNEIVEATGANENSVRGMLNKLRSAGLVDKVGDYYLFTGDFSADQGAEDDDDEDQNTEEAEKVSGQEPSASPAVDVFGEDVRPL